MKVAVVSLPGYEKAIAKLLTAAEREALEYFLAANPEKGAIVAGREAFAKLDGREAHPERAAGFE